MEIEIEHRPAYATATVSLEPNESIVAENDAMLAMTSNVKVETTSQALGGGGILKKMSRWLGGESFFNNVFTASGGKGSVTLAPALVGDVFLYQLNNSSIFIQSKSYLASAPGVTLDTKWGGAKLFFAGEGLFMLKASGTGVVLVNAFGAIHQVNVDGGFIIDTGHIVAFEDSLTYKIRRVGGWFSTIFSGEGLVCEFSGKGTLWIQTRNPAEYGKSVGAKLPPRS